MHSRIFQLSKEPIPRDEFIDESEFYENFVGRVADYVNGDIEEQRESDIEWLKGSLERIAPGYVNFDTEEECFQFLPGFTEFYGKKKLEKISSILAEGKAYKDIRWNLKEAIEDIFGFYFFCDFTGWAETEDRFLYEVEEGTWHYIGAIIDYHY